MSRSAGRPRRGEPSLERWQIIAKAFEILDAEGADGLTMRALGRALGVTPMALYHHVGSRTELFAAMSEAVYATLLTTPAGLRARLRGYCEQELADPNLTLAIAAGIRAGAVRSTEDALLTYDDELDTLLGAIPVRP